MPNILIVEDDININNLLCEVLMKAGYTCEQAFSGTEAKLLLNIKEKAYTLVLLDLMLPGASGEEVLKEIRKHGRLPVIVLTAKDSIDDKIGVLTDGADDYITKPFSVEEFLARLRVTIRRINYVQTPHKENSIFVNGELKIDYVSGCAYCRGKELHLTPIEYKLLCLLAKNIGKVLTHTYITREVWGNAWDNNVASLRVFMATLRKKIEIDTANPEYIQTHIGIGYRMLKLD